jgi:transcriptional regulator with XRE-family HTH domain
MDHKNYLSVASPKQIAVNLGERLTEIRLSLNQTQAQVSNEAGVSRGALVRLENGQGVSMDTFIRVMTALHLQGHLENLLPNPSIRPLERVALAGRERRRARPKQESEDDGSWTWGDDQ